MKIIEQASTKIDTKTLIASYDVGKTNLDFYSSNETGGKTMEAYDKVRNRGESILQHLDLLETLKVKSGMKSIVIVCEPSGGYELKLLNAARRRGIMTRYVSGEATCKAKSIVSNDAEKSDEKDPKIVDMLAKMKKTLSSEARNDEYEQLELINNIYEDESLQGSKVKNDISSCVDKLFCDYTMDRKNLYATTGRALFKLYHLNPYKIVADGRQQFIKRMKKESKNVRRATLSTLWADAESSVLNIKEQWNIDLYDTRITDLYNDYLKHEERKEKYKSQICILFEKTVEFQALQGSRISTFMLGRIIAETGPINGFSSMRKLLRYAGLNIIRKESGKYKGERKISKKGRVLLRKVLYQTVFSNMIPKGKLFHEYFKRKKSELKVGLKAMVAAMRKLLKMVFGVVHSKEVFCEDRVFSTLKIAS